jgi:hypothetical protein
MYVFPGDGTTVFVMTVNSTVTGPGVRPGFHPEARYELKVDPDRLNDAHGRALIPPNATTGAREGAGTGDRLSRLRVASNRLCGHPPRRPYG